jgi:hypothetical protein
MPLNTSIALQAKPIEFDNPIDVQSKALTLRQLAGRGQMQDMELQQAQESQQQQRTLGDIYRNGVGADGQPNHTAIVQQMAQQGLGKMIPGYLKQVADADKSRADVGHVGAQTAELGAKTQAANWELAKKKNDAMNGAISSLLTRPNLSHDDVIAEIVNLKNAGIIDAGQGFQMTRGLPSNPAELRQRLTEAGLKVMDAANRLKAMTPQFQMVDNGKTKTPMDFNAITNPAGPATVQMTTTPGEDLSATTQQRGQNMTASTAAAGRAQTERHFQVGQNTPQYMETDAGLVALPKKLVLGQSPTATPVMSADGAPLGKPLKDIPPAVNKKIIEGRQSLNNIAQAIAVVKANPDAFGIINAVPFVERARQGDTKGVDARAQVANIGSLKLHDRSGAAVSASEFPRLAPFIPSSSDKPEAVVTKLQQMKRIAEEELGLYTEAYSKPNGYKESKALPKADPSVPDDIAAILRKHGGN